MIELKELVAYLDALLEAPRFQDYAPNGLQVEGRTRIGKMVGGVTASLALLDEAIESGADAILVHHGYFWRGENPCVVGMKSRRLKALLRNDVSLLAYHLPLDAHPTLGNNAALATLLELSVEGRMGSGVVPIGMYGRLPCSMDGAELSVYIESRLGHSVLHIPGGTNSVRTIGWCTGAAQSYIDDAVKLGLDAFLTGEASEQTVHIARESAIHFFAAGHHATERGGVQSVLAHLTEKYSIETQFIDIANPV